jgi:hypothetical protein
MDWETGGVIDSVGGLEKFERLVERGRQLHNQAVFELFEQLVSNAKLFLKKTSVLQLESRAQGIVAEASHDTQETG